MERLKCGVKVIKTKTLRMTGVFFASRLGIYCFR